MSPEIWRDVFDAIEDPAFLHDSQFRVLLANRAYCREAGVTEAQALGKPYWEVFPPGTGPMPGCKAAMDRKGQGGSQEEVSVGEKLFLSKSYTARDDQGKSLHALHILSDITERKRVEESLRQREAELNESQRVAHIGSWDWNVLNETIWWSDECYRIFGRDPKQPTPNYVDHLKAYSPESAQRLDVVAKRAIETGEPYEVDLELAQPTPTTQWILARGEAKRDASGKIWGLRGTAQNITERKRAEAALRENQARLDLALRSASMGVWHLDIIENRRYFDDQACRLLGIDPATFTGAAEEFFGAVHPDDRETIKAALARTMEQDIPYEPEFRAVWPDGSIHYLTSRGRLVRDDKGRPARINGVIWDISERKRAQEALARKERYYRKMIEGGSEVFLLMDRAGTLLYRNESGKQLTGWETAEVLGKPVTDFVSAESLPLVRNAMAEAFAKPDQLIRVEVGMLRKDGTQVEIEALAKNLLDDPDIAGIVVTARDITERKQAEAKLAEQFNELQRWNEATQGREMRILDLKHEVNELLGQAGLPLRYPSAESDGQKEE